MTEKTYDNKCYWLAEDFLEDETHTEDDIDKLAWLIQETIEDYIQEMQERRIKS